jgi:hypothetical protein
VLTAARQGDWFKRDRAVAASYDKLAVRYEAIVHIAAINEWLPIADDRVMTWTTAEITRTIAPLGALTGDERTLADAWLDLQRQTLLWKCGGLTAAELNQRAIEPSRRQKG